MNDAELMAQDTVLPGAIRPSGDVAKHSGSVFVTGATGFLGRHLVARLLETPDVRVTCLVRAPDGDAARERLHSALAGVMPGLGGLPERVSVIAGDIERERLGLGERAYAALADGSDRIIHCAAAVNWTANYRRLRGINVRGSMEILRLACTGAPKPVLFVSTIGVCFAQPGNGRIDESTDMRQHADALPLGYARSKCVAESLFRQAADRGLPVTIVRSGLIAGDTATGALDHDDLLCAMIEGSISAGIAADLDWVVDCNPVDHVAAVLARLARGAARGLDVVHLVHERGRHWREIVLWMNLHGHPVRLVPVQEWKEFVFRSGAPSWRLRRYRKFFGWDSPGTGPAPYQAYLAPEQARVDSRASEIRLERMGLRPPPLDVALLSRHMEHLEEAGLVRRVRNRGPRGGAPAILAQAMRRWLAVRGLSLACATERPLRDSHGILNELAAIGGEDHAGVRIYDLALAGNGAGHATMPVVLKVKAPDRKLERLTAEVARQCDPALGRWFDAFRGDLGLRGGHEREIALYSNPEPRLRLHTPACYGTVSDRSRGIWAFALEYVEPPVAARPDGGQADWSAPDIEAVIAGLGAIHSIWYGRESELASHSWMPRGVDAQRQAAMTPLWSALARFSSPCFSEWLGFDTGSMQSALAGTVGVRAAELERMPRTLIHNDFNPRNLLLREAAGERRLCAFDWELATVGVPQHDLAEFLCFALPDAAGPGVVAGWLEAHREAIAMNCGREPSLDTWLPGFRLALRQLLAGRFAMYAVMHRFRPMTFLPRVIQNWMRLDGIVTTISPDRPRVRQVREGSFAIRPAAIPVSAKPAATARRYSGARRRMPQA